MKKKVVSVLLSTAMVASMLVGCGSSSADTAAPAETTEEAPAEDTAEEAPADDAAAEEAPAEDAAADTAASGDKFYIYSWNTELQERLKFVTDAYPEIADRIEYVNVGDSAIYQEKIELPILVSQMQILLRCILTPSRSQPTRETDP